MKPIDIARKLNISTSSLRSYENRGLVPPAERLSNGYRMYTEKHVAYFQCIVAMSPGFGMEITTDVLQRIQQGKVHEALWIVVQAQADHCECRNLLGKAQTILYAEKGEYDLRTIEEAAQETGVTDTALRYWCKEGYIEAEREVRSDYRLFDGFQVFKMFLMKITQNAVYSSKVVKLKNDLKQLKPGHEEQVQKVIDDMEEHLNERNRKQLHGLYYLHQLCEILKV